MRDKMVPWTYTCYRLLFFALALIGAESCVYANDLEACAACGGGFLVFALVMFVVHIILLVWVARDAKARGAGGLGWMILVLFFGVIGLLIYIFARPQGETTTCSHCQNKKLAAMAKCPHCGN
jgi:hypothetical protein